MKKLFVLFAVILLAACEKEETEDGIEYAEKYLMCYENNSTDTIYVSFQTRSYFESGMIIPGESKCGYVYSSFTRLKDTVPINITPFNDSDIEDTLYLNTRTDNYFSYDGD